MRAEFNGNGFRAEMSESFDEAFGPRVSINLVRFYNGSMVFSILAFVTALAGLATAFFGQFGVDILTQVFAIASQQLALWFNIISLSISAISCFFALWAITLRRAMRGAQTIEETAFYSACTFMSLFSFVIIALCVILNIVFIIT